MIVSAIQPERVFKVIASRVKKCVPIEILTIRDSPAFIILVTLCSVYSTIIERSDVRIKFPIIRIWIRIGVRIIALLILVIQSVNSRILTFINYIVADSPSHRYIFRIVHIVIICVLANMTDIQIDLPIASLNPYLDKFGLGLIEKTCGERSHYASPSLLLCDSAVGYISLVFFCIDYYVQHVSKKITRLISSIPVLPNICC